MNPITDICLRAQKANARAFVVGGYNRDRLLGLNPKDQDVVVVGFDSLQDAIEHLKPEGHTAIGQSFPVLLVNGIEVALARRESKSGIGHNGFDCQVQGVTLEEDLHRRDLTINAIAMDPLTEQIIDPFSGIRDIKSRVLRPVSAAFNEDPLRVLRAARFAAKLEFRISQDLVHYAELSLGELESLSQERVWAELAGALSTDRPSLFFEALDDFGALEVVFPEIAALKGRIQPPAYHPEGDAYVHTLLCVDRCRQLGGDLLTTFATLLHDLGKAVTPDDDLPRHINHERLGVPIVHKICDRLKVSNRFRKAAATTAREHLNIHNFLKMRPIKRVRLLTRLNAIHEDELMNVVTLASMADAQGRGPTMIDRPYPQREAVLDAAKLIRTVNGHQFSHITDGPKLAQRLEQERSRLLK